MSESGAWKRELPVLRPGGHHSKDDRPATVHGTGERSAATRVVWCPYCFDQVRLDIGRGDLSWSNPSADCRYSTSARHLEWLFTDKVLDRDSLLRA